MKSVARIVILAILGINAVLFRPDIAVRDWLTPDVGVLRGSKYLKKYSKKIVILTSPSPGGGGTGFALKAPSGITYTVTNNHVCELAEGGKMRAVWDNGRSVLIDVLEVDREHDLCIMDGLPLMEGLELGKQELDVYDPAFIIGHPRLAPNTFSEGLVRERLNMDIIMGYGDAESCRAQKLKYKLVNGWLGPEGVCYEEYDAFDTSIKGYPGNSGSPVFNFDGQVVGVIFAGNNITNDMSYVPLEFLQDLIRTY